MVGFTLLLSSDRERLTGEPARDEVDVRRVGDFPDVPVLRFGSEVFGVDLSAEFVNFTTPFTFPSRTFET